jgi:ankyrin repeat protein
MDSAILNAAARGDLPTLERLLYEDPALVHDRDQYNKTPLHYAAEHNQAAAAALLLDQGASVDAVTTWGMTPLAWAANMGSRAVGDVLLAHGAQLDFWSAAGLGMLEQVKTLFAADQVSDAFYIAARNGHIAVAEFLLARGARVDQRGFFNGTGLHWAANNGHAEMVDWLLRHGADPSLTDSEFSATPEAWAREGKHEAIARRIEQHRGTA